MISLVKHVLVKKKNYSRVLNYPKTCVSKKIFFKLKRKSGVLNYPKTGLVKKNIFFKNPVF